jgi:hypothetical protein
MATSSQIYAHSEHNKSQRKPAAAGESHLESFGVDCKATDARSVSVATSWRVTQSASPRGKKH